MREPMVYRGGRIIQKILVCFVITAAFLSFGLLAWADTEPPHETNDLLTELPPPEPPAGRAASSESLVDNGDGTFTWRQTISANSTPPHYVSPSGYGFGIFSWFNQDYGWQHNFPSWDAGDLAIFDSRLIITAWDVDSEPFHGYEGEYDGISVDGVILDPGYLQGYNGQWSVTEFNIQRSDIVDDGLINVWIDIDMHHSEEIWGTTLDNCVMEITYSIGVENVPPYAPDLVINPDCPGLDEDLVVEVVGPTPADPNGDEVTYIYEWFVDIGTGEFIEDVFAGRGEHDSNVVPSDDTVNGDVWRVQVRSRDIYGALGNYSTETWNNPVGCSPPEIEILDATPYLLNNILVHGFTVIDLNTLSGIGVTRNQTRVDGNSRLLIRYTSSYSGDVTVEISDPQYGEVVGTLHTLNEIDEGTAATSEMQVTDRGRQAFFVYTPPNVLWTGSSYPATSRTIDVDITLTSTTGDVFHDSAEIVLHPRQLVYIHGIWAGSEVWSYSHFDHSDYGIPCYTIDYGDDSHQGVEANFNKLEIGYVQLMMVSRMNGIASTQIDVVAHSMGGLLTRRWAAEFGFKNLNNFRSGKVNRLITVDTPHFGSPFANQYKWLHDWGWTNGLTAGCFPTMTLLRRYGQGVKDLMEFSDTICELGETDIPTHVVIGEGGRNLYILAEDPWYKAMGIIAVQCGLEPWALFGSQDHDFVVGSASQYGGLSSSFASLNETGLAGEHDGALTTEVVGSQVLNAILSDGNDGYAESLPDPNNFGSKEYRPSFPSTYELRSQAKSSVDCISLIAPIEGATIYSGSQLHIEADLGDLDVEEAVFVMLDGIAEFVELVDGAGDIAVPDMGPGVYSSLLFVRSTDDELCVSEKIDLVVPIDGTVLELSLLNDILPLSGPGWTGRFVVRAVFADGSEYSISDPRAGIAYQVADPTVAQVLPDGEILAIGPGETTVTIQVDGHQVVGQVLVLHAVANDPPTAVLTPAEAAICVGDTLLLDGSESYDIDSLPSQPVMFDWDLDGDGEFDDATGAQIQLYSREVGNFQVFMQVKDGAGATDEASVLVVASNCGPVIEQVEPETLQPGNLMEINGLLFGDDPGPGNHSTAEFNVSLNGNLIPDLSIFNWSENKIQMRVPSGTAGGDLTVTADGVTSRIFQVIIDAGSACSWVNATVPPLDNPKDGHGIAWGDFDNDGDDDLFLANIGNNALLRNDGGGNFTTMPALPNNGGDSRGVAWADYDNDGDLDLYVVNWGSANRLYRNEGNGAFAEVTDDVTGCDLQGNNPAWADVDNDGDLDLFITNYDAPNKLLRNDGGEFVLVEGTPLSFTDLSRGCAWGDFDGDMDQDLYVSVQGGPNHLFRNDGSFTFTDVTVAPLDDGGYGKGVAWGDYDNDGDLDLYLVNRNSANRLFNNDNGVFSSVAGALLADEGDGRTCGWGDYNNDGWLDLFVTNNSGDNKLFHNLGGTAFSDTTCGDLLVPITAWGMGWSDYDNDGDLDLYVSHHTWEGLPNHMFRNDMITNKSWLKVELVGSASNRYGVGAKVIVENLVDNTRQLREISSGSGYMSQPSVVAQFGLEYASTVDVTVYWPSGLVQQLTNQPVNQRLIVAEAASTSGVDDITMPLTYDVSCYPNPFNPMTNIEFSLPRAGAVSLQIYDISGRLMRTLVTGTTYDAGIHSVLWNGTDNAGAKVASGVYFYRFTSGSHDQTGRMMLIK